MLFWNLYTSELDKIGIWPHESAIEQAVADVAMELDRFKEQLSVEQDAIDTLETKRRSLWEDYKRAQSKLAVLSELRTRFILLSDQYRSDLSRLEAISEAGFRLAQMPMERCPVCGALPEHHRKDHQKDKPPEELAKSCEMEASKIRCLIEDLSETNKSNDVHISIKNDYANKIHEELIEVDKIIKDELKPRFQELAARITELTNRQPLLLRALYLYECVENFKKMIDELEKGKSPKSDKDAFSNLSALQTEEFCKEVEAVLREWKFPDLDRVTFSERDDDIIISGQERASHGKGVRAITHTAFNIGLLKFCLNRSMPHPGFLVVDSPLVVYRQADPDFDPKDKDFSPDVKEAFYRSLSYSTNIQVIICENDDPPAELHANIIQFTKTNEGRYGFIPRDVKGSQG